MSDNITDHTHQEKAVEWPPKVLYATPLGYIHDASGNYYPRDIGRSSVFPNGTVVWQFGDTFCHDSKKEFLGFANNTCAKWQAGTTTAYSTQYTDMEQQKTTGFDGEAVVANMIEKRPDERNDAKRRLKIWCFSGILPKHTEKVIDEDSEFSDTSPVHGWTFFEMWMDDLVSGKNEIYLYTGIAEVISYRGEIKGTPLDAGYAHSRELFYTDEPRFGTFCALNDGPYVYAYGHSSDGSKDIILARVQQDRADERRHYSYWTKTGWAQNFRGYKPVLKAMQHGQIFKTPMFGSGSPYKYAFVGCNSMGDSLFQMGRAVVPEGPWEVFPLDMKIYHLNDPEHAGPFRYCMYPHPWMYDIAKGDLMVSWSEGGMTGGVLAAKIRFKLC